jgi:hypothetical protein
MVTFMSPPTCRPWWLNPAWLFAAVIGGTMVAAALQSDHAYEQYGTPKYIEAYHVMLAAVAILVFAIGARLEAAISGVPQATPPKSDRVVRFWFWLSFALTLLGYTVWAAEGFRSGFSLGMLRELVTNPDLIVDDAVREEMFPTIPGVTTCTQFGMAAVLLGLWLYFVHGDRRVIWPMVLICALAAVRALVLSERLAVIELLVPGVLIWLWARVLVRTLAPPVRAALQLAPVLGILMLLLFFGSAEYFRSWQHYQDEFDSISEFTVWRFAGYYTTGHNNGAMALETQAPLPLPFWTIRPLWEFPGVSNTSFAYEKLTGINPFDAKVDMTERYGAPELNNEGGLFMPLVDFGVIGYCAFWFGFGFLAGRLYRCFLAGTLAGLTLYPLVFVAMLEAPRVLYLSYTRAFPTLVTCLLVVWLTRRLVPDPTVHRAAIQGPLWSAIDSARPRGHEPGRGYQ